MSSVSSVYYLFCATDPNAAEIYSDRESRGISLEPIRKRIISCRCRRWAGYAILAALLVWAMFFYSSEYDIQSDRAARLPLQLLILFRPNALLLAACMIGIWVQSVQDSRLLHRTYQALIQGLAPPSSKGPRKAILCQKVVFLVLLALMVASSAAQVWSQWARFPLEDVPADMSRCNRWSSKRFCLGRNCRTSLLWMEKRRTMPSWTSRFLRRAGIR
ncbi:hypothetical protein B5E65_00795 [Gemmiger sp. An120]|nr:hypothetical protein B5E65_00795 [Gemmiger sp. An120]